MNPFSIRIQLKFPGSGTCWLQIHFLTNLCHFRAVKLFPTCKKDIQNIENGLFPAVETIKSWYALLQIRKRPDQKHFTIPNLDPDPVMTWPVGSGSVMTWPDPDQKLSYRRKTLWASQRRVSDPDPHFWSPWIRIQKLILWSSWIWIWIRILILRQRSFFAFWRK